MMKFKTVVSVLFGVFAFAVLISCKHDESDELTQSDVVERYLEFKTKLNAVNANFGPMGNFLSVIAASQLHSNRFELKSALGDTVFTDSIPGDTSGYWNYWTCATVTEFDNGDGTRTTVYDYGDGCNEYGSLIRGKITYIWKNEGDDYYSKVLYDHYYSYGMEMNGYSEYSFTSDGNSYFEYDSSGIKNDSADSPVVNFYWSGASTGKDDMTVILDSGEKYAYSSNFSNKWENSSSTVLEGEYVYTSETEGYEYHYLVTLPLFYNYECPDTWIPVSGIETIHYVDPDETYDFLIDYGNETCDNLATVTENGETSVIDFGELITVYCGTDGSDSVSVGNKR
jgi:hypothetical protein